MMGLEIRCQSEDHGLLCLMKCRNARIFLTQMSDIALISRISLQETAQRQRIQRAFQVRSQVF